MSKSKTQNKSKIQNPKFKTSVLMFEICVLCLLWILCFGIWNFAFTQESDLEFTLDITTETVALPKIFKTNIDLSGRGFNREQSWPQGLASQEALDIWQKDIGFSGVYRLQYNLWEISERAKGKDLEGSLLSNYEAMLKKITEAGGITILDIFGTPAGLGKVLDKKSAPVDLRAFKELVKGHIKNLSCTKRYNIWYELWSAPDLDDFFLGRKQEYLNLYRAVAEAIEELEAETKIYIPLGAPSVSYWFQNLDGNTIVTPERSLIYELIQFCSRYRLPLDFITWHTYSTDPKVEKEITIYNKTAIALIRNWLTYFNLDRNTPLIVDEWNYDRDANVLPERHQRSFVSASYIPARLKNMYEVGLDYQTYYSLEDFQNNKEGINRNVGVFWFDSDTSIYKGGPKSMYNVFRMLAKLGSEMFLSCLKLDDEFVGAIAAKTQDALSILIYNYIDPQIAMNFLSRNIASLNNAERKTLLNLIKSDRLGKIYAKELDISKLRASNKVKNLLKKAQELNEQANKFKDSTRNLKIGVKNLKGQNYLYQRYAIDSSCSMGCDFIPVEEKEVNVTESYQELLTLSPYSVNMIILKEKPPEPESALKVIAQPESSQNAVSPGVNTPSDTQEAVTSGATQDTGNVGK